MARKALAARQKMQLKLEPSQRISKPRNPVAVAVAARLGAKH